MRVFRPLYPEFGLFAQAMDRELRANRNKGGPAAWREDGSQRMLTELTYHQGKLANAVQRGNVHEVLEFAADVANLAMMVADAHGALTKDIVSPPSYASGY